MKSERNLFLSPLVLGTLLFAFWPQINSPTDAAQLVLSNECSSNHLVLHWNGAPGYTLQQATNLPNPVWQDVPWLRRHERLRTTHDQHRGLLPRDE